MIDNGNNTVTAEKGDCLWDIAEKYLGNGNRYQELASINNISNPNLIYIGQIIKLSAGAGGGSSSTSTSTQSNKAIIEHFGVQTNSENTIFATWKWEKADTDKYEIWWEYDTGDGIWFEGSITSTPHNQKQSTYSIPSNARRVQFWVKPIAKDGKWTAEWSTPKIYTDTTPLKTPSVPSVKIEKYKLTAELDSVENDAASIEFQVYKDDTTKFHTSKKISVTATRSVSYTCNVDAGGEYKVRCRAWKGSDKSEWTAFSAGASTIPSAPKSITTIKATSEKSVYLEWSTIKTAKTYDIEYTTEKRYFDGSDQTTTKTGIEFNHYEIVSMEPGDEYFFRIRAVNDSGESAWSEISSIVIGEKPSAPTTYSSTTTVIVGEPLTLYWIHNSADNSSQKYAELELTINGVKMEPTITINNVTDEDERDKTSKCVVNTSTGDISWVEDDGEHTFSTGYSFVEGVEIQWRVRTSGITNEYGDWSVQRTVDVYAPPTLVLSVTDLQSNPISTLTSFPFYVYGIPGPNTQTPIGYHLTVKANESYTTTDQIGNEQVVNKNEEIYSNFFDITDSLLVEFTPGIIDLENGMTYTVVCTVTMNSGLTSEASAEFSVSWDEHSYVPNAEITYDDEKYVTYIRPYCEEYTTVYVKVNKNDDVYSVTDEKLDKASIKNVYTTSGEIVYLGIRNNAIVYYCIAYVDGSGNPIDPVYYRVNNVSGVYTITSTRYDQSTIRSVLTSSGEEVLLGAINDVELYYTSIIESSLIENVTLSVFRREFDGGFTEIMTGIQNSKQTITTDPHPALDYARYRIVSISDTTGAISYYDMPGIPIGEKGIIIQWDEEWSTFDVTEDSRLRQPAWDGSLVYLPYNVDVSDSNSQDVTLVSYIGRKRPVSYYGTHLGEKSAWNVEIPKDDKETLYALRRLSSWMGDVYVREPSGSGYWANISVSFSQKHCDVTIPVSFDITRVEGGV